jgi:ATP-dependent exoDNAse (exonuclease V) beta subunit
MMSGEDKSLPDNAARRNAISQHDRSMLVEAGAGSGKTAALAGRIAYMLAEGIPPRSIAAVTFTELAASELVIRLREYVSELSHGKIARELQIAFPDGLSQLQRDKLNKAAETIDEITCTTIHGFCQRLIKPYPAEANIDPGASITDRSRADLAFGEIVDNWLRERLSGETDGVIAEMVSKHPAGSVTLIHKIAANLRKCRSLIAPPTAPLSHCANTFRQSVQDFEAFINSTTVVETDTSSIADQFLRMANDLPQSDQIDAPANLVGLLSSGAHAELLTTTGNFKAYKKKTKWVTAAKAQSLPVAEAERLNDTATDHYARCCESWNKLKEAAASLTLAALIDDIDPVLQAYRAYKRNAALLDFDDLIYAARDLLRDHEEVRKALGQRFNRVLVDEFQDTDPLQTEIFWRLCGDPLPEASIEDWSKYKI